MELIHFIIYPSLGLVPNSSPWSWEKFSYITMVLCGNFRAVFLSTDSLLTSPIHIKNFVEKNKPRKHRVITGKKSLFSFKAIFNNVKENVYFWYLFHSCVNIRACARVFMINVHAFDIQWNVHLDIILK